MRPIPAVPMPLSLSDLRAACRRDAPGRVELEEAVAHYQGAAKAVATSSGRAALWLALRALHRLRPERPRVIAPAWTCPTVGRAIMTTGLECLCVDVSPEDFALDPERLARLLDDRTLAVVAAHMFGVPADVAALRALCDESGAWLVEDAAQCVGGRSGDGLVGTTGHLGFLSLGRSKNVRGYEGGVLWINDPELAGPIAEEYEQLEPAPARSGEQLRQAAITVLSAPGLWRLVRAVPGAGVGREDQDFDPHPARLADWMAGLGLLSFSRLEEYNRRRRSIAEWIMQELVAVPGLHLQQARPGDQTTRLRLGTRLSAERAPERSRILAALQRRGIDARAFYTDAMYQYEWFTTAPDQPTCPRAEELVASNVVLPLYYGLDEAQARAAGRAVVEEVSAQ